MIVILFPLIRAGPSLVTTLLIAVPVSLVAGITSLILCCMCCKCWHDPLCSCSKRSARVGRAQRFDVIADVETGQRKDDDHMPAGNRHTAKPVSVFQNFHDFHCSMQLVCQ